MTSKEARSQGQQASTASGSGQGERPEDRSPVDKLMDIVNTDMGEPIAMPHPSTMYTRLPLEERVEAAKSQIEYAIARGECGHCAEGFARSQYNIPAEIELTETVTEPVTRTRRQVKRD
jgi:hypothetical protein